MSAVCLKDVDSWYFICYHADMLILAHDPAGMLTAFVSIVLLFVFGMPLLYSVLSALSFMLCGIGADVAWWRRLLAPALSAVGCFVLIGCSMLLLAALPSYEGTMPLWGEVVYYIVCVVWFLLPLLICRAVLKFTWLRSVASVFLIPLLHALLGVICGAGLLALLGNSQQGIDEQQSTVTGAVETPPAPELPADGEADTL